MLDGLALSLYQVEGLVADLPHAIPHVKSALVLRAVEELAIEDRLEQQTSAVRCRQEPEAVSVGRLQGPTDGASAFVATLELHLDTLAECLSKRLFVREVLLGERARHHDRGDNTLIESAPRDTAKDTLIVARWWRLFSLECEPGTSVVSQMGEIRG